MADKPVKVLVYSDDASVREAVRLALGRRLAADLPEIDYVEVATDWAVLHNVNGGGIDLLILDGEAVPAGGLGVCRTIKKEVHKAPPVLALLGRPQDHWLAAWAKVDGAAGLPVDPFALADVAARLLRRRLTDRGVLASSAG